MVPPRHRGGMTRRHQILARLLVQTLTLLLLASGSLGAATEPTVRYDWPVPGAVVEPFDEPAEPWLAGHRGVDLAAEVGETVRAAADGVVAYAGVVAGKPVVSLDHADGIRTTYEPVLAGVEAGDAVVLGQEIGTLAAGHGEDDLHWGARRGREAYLDPVTLVEPVPVIRLYPLPGSGIRFQVQSFGLAE